MYLSGELTPLAVVESLLPLIRRDIDRPSNHSVAFIDCHFEAVIEAAKASTLRYKQGKPLSSKLFLGGSSVRAIWQTVPGCLNSRYLEAVKLNQTNANFDSI